jgi:hypothetical protein
MSIVERSTALAAQLNLSPEQCIKRITGPRNGFHHPRNQARLTKHEIPRVQIVSPNSLSAAGRNFEVVFFTHEGRLAIAGNHVIPRDANGVKLVRSQCQQLNGRRSTRCGNSISNQALLGGSCFVS